MEFIKETVCLPETVCGGGTQIMVEGDIIVPDAKPDVVRILQVNAASALLSAEAGDGRGDFEGVVNVDILYAPEDGEVSINAMKSDMSFKHRIDNQKMRSDCPISAVSDVERVEFQVLNSRKVRIKAILSLEYTQTRERELEIPTDIEGDAEMKKSSVTIRKFLGESRKDFDVKESVEVPPGKVSVKQILTVTHGVPEKKFKIVTGKVVLRGMLNISVLYTGSDNSVRFMDADIPFTEVMDLDGITEESQCDIDCRVMEIKYEICEDSDGDMRIVDFDISMQAVIQASEETEIEYIDDCYCIGANTILDRENVQIERAVLLDKYQNTLREITAPKRTDPQITAVYGVKASAVVSSASVENGKLLVEGKIEAYVLYLTDSAEIPVYSLKKDIPFSYAMDCADAKKDMDAVVKAEVEHISYSINAANEVELRCILGIEAKLIQGISIDLIKEAEVCPVEGDDKKGIVIYFVQTGDTMWDIAKRYHVTMDSITELNELEKEKLEIGCQLVIPAQ